MISKESLHCAALFTGAHDLHERIDNMENDLEADLLRAEQEAKLLKYIVP
jgi:hypothetical protein